ncbi:MAG: MCP four helix bundle domain-containing protein [Syntrophobacteraceae bacterium]|nr:MCP four helix bundle domain-containing protein [Desulfobacteraceae bacterium]
MTKNGLYALKFFNLPAKAPGALRVFSLSCMLAAAVALSATTGVGGSYADANSAGMPGIQYLHAIARAMVTIDGAENALLAANIDEKKRQKVYSQFDAARKKLDESLKTYESMLLSSEESRIWKDFTVALAKWGSDHERFIQLAKNHDRSKTPESYRIMSAQALEVNTASLAAAVSLLDAAIEASLGGMKAGDESSGNISSTGYLIGTFLVGGSISAAIVLLVFAIRARRPRRHFRKGSRKLSLDVEP